ncbi:unnamed protein product [Thlaspi arvense]|uniref:TF-B3 domain-containing protein n=1 Tax=Thlaspi arvense TaxID=13288 RepID=A0AAU9RDF0_THLAR|nr:unnamed protein product [Thlaspi arvense]
MDIQLDLPPYDPWVVRKILTDYDTCYGDHLILPQSQFADFIIPEMKYSNPAMVQQIVSGNNVDVKIHIIEEGPQAADYRVTLEIHNHSYMISRGWSDIVKARDYKTGNEIGLMWENMLKRFILHQIS